MTPAKRKPVTSAEQLARQIVRDRAGGICEGCGKAPATDWSHRVAEGQGGPWDAANGLHLCHSDHMWGHTEPLAARKLGWLLLSTDDFLTFPALH